jgi:hypothetical protein
MCQALKQLPQIRLRQITMIFAIFAAAIHAPDLYSSKDGFCSTAYWIEVAHNGFPSLSLQRFMMLLLGSDLSATL